jgi:nitric oxide reductase large subunit
MDIWLEALMKGESVWGALTYLGSETNRLWLKQITDCGGHATFAAREADIQRVKDTLREHDRLHRLALELGLVAVSGAVSDAGGDVASVSRDAADDDA